MASEKTSVHVKLQVSKSSHEQLLKITQSRGDSFRTLIRDAIHQTYVDLIQSQQKELKENV